MDSRTRKLITMHEALHPRHGVDRLHVSRKEGGRVRVSIEDSVDASIQRLKDYINKPRGRLTTTIRNNINHARINRTEITRKQKWDGKQHYGNFKRQKKKNKKKQNEMSYEKTWTWLRKVNLKWETESLLIAAQEQRHKDQIYQGKNR